MIYIGERCWALEEGIELVVAVEAGTPEFEDLGIAGGGTAALVCFRNPAVAKTLIALNVAHRSKLDPNVLVFTDEWATIITEQTKTLADAKQATLSENMQELRGTSGRGTTYPMGRTR